ncbi:Hypothetical predicted protein, partial [Pelobates cultripes]
MNWSKIKFYEPVNKMDTLLARVLKPRMRRGHITSIRHPDNLVKTMPKDIADVFTDYYKSLYNHSPNSETMTMRDEDATGNFLKDLGLPKLPQE